MTKMVDGKKISTVLVPRIEYIDLLRGIGIILMTIGHVGFTASIEKWIYSFHMPLFYFISGYFFKDTKLDKATNKLAKTLLLPYIGWGMTYYFVYVIKEYAGGRQPSLLPLWHLFFVNTDGLAISPALWFFTSLFLTEIIYLFLNQFVKNRKLITCIVIITMLFGMIMPTLSFYRLPWAMDTAFVGLGFYHVARVWREQAQIVPALRKIGELKMAPAIILLFVFSILVLMNDYVNMRRGLYVHIPIFITGSFGLIFALWNICRTVETHVRGGAGAVVLKIVKNIGCNSVIYVCMNHLVIKGLNICRPLFEKFWGFMGQQCLILILSMIFMYVFDKAIQKIKLRMLMGKK